MNAEILLPSSKSISNRILIIHALAESLEPIQNLSLAKDTQDLVRCLASKDKLIHVGEGATTLRFLLAYFALKNKKIQLHCAPSLQHRPLKPLLEILEQLGCKFNYLGDEFHLPLEIIEGIQSNYNKKLIIDASISSQFISAIVLIAPYLNDGLEIENSNQLVSQPYILMTKKLMIEFGAKLQELDHSMYITPSKYSYRNYFIEADWSSASFFYAFFGIMKTDSFYFPNLKISGLQGDEILITFFNQFGIVTNEKFNGVLINREKVEKPYFVEFDFTNFPDLFPPIALFCAITKTNTIFKGLQNLVYKESNRLKIINDFLIRQDVIIKFYDPINGDLSAIYEMSNFSYDIPEFFPSHNDHRIAMSFSLLNTIKKITIENPEVVKKSFPGYWEQLIKIF